MIRNEMLYLLLLKGKDDEMGVILLSNMFVFD